MHHWIILFTFSLEIVEYGEDLLHEYDEDVGLYEDEDDENGKGVNISWFWKLFPFDLNISIKRSYEYNRTCFICIVSLPVVVFFSYAKSR